MTDFAAMSARLAEIARGANAPDHDWLGGPITWPWPSFRSAFPYDWEREGM